MHRSITLKQYLATGVHQPGSDPWTLQRNHIQQHMERKRYICEQMQFSYRFYLIHHYSFWTSLHLDCV